MDTIQTQVFPTPWGELLIGSFDGKLCLCDWRYRKMRSAVDKRLQKHFAAEYREEDNDVLAETRKQLREYWSGERQEFTVELAFAGTEFQQRVWRELCLIPFGETSTYLKLSQKLGNPDAIRAVASANGANAISIIVPCHRIIGSDGSLVGYAGGLTAKKNLLTLENPRFAMQFSTQESLAL